MWHTNPSGNEKSVEDIYDWYLTTKDSIDLHRSLVLGTPEMQPPKSLLEKFKFSSEKEIRSYFDEAVEELDRLACLSLLASFEAALMLDTSKRIKGKAKSGIAKDLKGYCIERSKKNGRPSVTVIIKKWKQYTCSQEFAVFTSAFKYRHWVAHGRHWQLANNQIYSPAMVKQILDDIISCMRTYCSDFLDISN